MVGTVDNDAGCQEVGQDSLLQCNHPNCGQRFNKLTNFQAHQLLHSGTRPFKCEVEGCSAAYTRRQHLTRHTSISHGKEQGLFRCGAEDCVASFHSNQSLHQHFRRAHFGHKLKPQGTLKCEQCDLEFPSISKLQQHMTTHSFTCSSCSRVFRRESDLKKHEARHQSETSKSTRKCKLCDREFENLESLAKHKATAEHQQKQTAALACSTCGKSFRDLGNLNCHLQVHSPGRTIFRCPYSGCDKSYYFDKNLRHHMRSVHQADQFPRPSCSVCSKSFSSKHRLQSHAKLKHSSDSTAVETKIKKKSQASGRLRKELVQKLSGNQDCRKVLKPKRPPGRLYASINQQPPANTGPVLETGSALSKT